MEPDHPLYAVCHFIADAVPGGHDDGYSVVEIRRINQLLHAMVTQLGVNVSAFESYVLFGAHNSFAREFVPVYKLYSETLTGLSWWKAGQKINADLVVKCPAMAYIKPCHVIVMSFLLVAAKHVPSMRVEIVSALRRLKTVAWGAYVETDVSAACNAICADLGVQLFHPLVRHKDIWDTIMKMKKRARAPVLHAVSVGVPAPSLRVELTHSFSSMHADVLDNDEQACWWAFHNHAKSVPCGNPFETIMHALTYMSIIKDTYAVFPAAISQLDAGDYALFLRVLAHNLLSSLLSLPILTENVQAAVLRKTVHAQEAVICLDCGHCLNFGRGKFAKVNLKPAHVFYCRDQKEKHLTICAATGRVYCYFCGSAHIASVPLVYAQGQQAFLRAVLANNCVAAIAALDQTVGLIVPCLGHVSCGACLYKKLTIANVLQLTLYLENFTCQKCAQ